MYKLNEVALEAYTRAIENALEIEPLDELIEIVLEQEVVSYCDANGCVTFDIYDLEYEEDQGSDNCNVNL